MAGHRDHEPRSWKQEEADGERAIAELRRSLERLRGQVGAYRERVGDDDKPRDGEPQASGSTPNT